MQIVIKIPEEDYDDILNGEVKASAINWSTFNAIRNGTPLPKGHGKLKDADELYLKFLQSKEPFFDIDDVRKKIYKAPTVIEADKAESDG